MDIDEFTSKFCRIACRQFETALLQEKAITSLVLLLGICVSLCAVLPTFKQNWAKPTSVTFQEVIGDKSKGQHWRADLTYTASPTFPMLDVCVFVALVIGCLIFCYFSFRHSKLKSQMEACAYHAAIELAHHGSLPKATKELESQIKEQIAPTKLGKKLAKFSESSGCDCATGRTYKALATLVTQYLRDQSLANQPITESRPGQPEQ